MRILELHCDYFYQLPRSKALKSVGGLSDEEKAGYRVENALVVFVTVEAGDDSSVAKKAAFDIEKNFSEVKAATVFVNPYAHLSNDLAKPDKAQQLLYELWQEVRKFSPDAKKGVFGYYKEFELKCKGHPLSELSKTITSEQLASHVASGVVESKAVAAHTAKKTAANPEILNFVVPKKEDTSDSAVAKNTGQFLLAMAVSKAHPKAVVAASSVGEQFYADFDVGKTFSEADIAEIEEGMERLVKAKLELKESKVSVANAKELLGENHYRVFLLDSVPKDSTVYLVEADGFADLACGPVCDNSSKLAAFKVTHAGGAYWLDDSSNKQLQRITGMAFESEKMKEEYLSVLAQAEKRDHRKIGKELKLFAFAEEVGMGLPLWLPDGDTLRHLLIEYMRQVEEKHGYKYVHSPEITKSSLYFASGHLPYYAESMYAPIEIDGAQYYLKPMNCPHHHVIERELVTSYRDLPLRLAEAGTCYRHELSGVMYGLIRARCFTQNDSHIYMAPKQVEQEFIGVLKLFKEVYGVMGIKDYWYRLSLPDFEKNPDKYGGAADRAKWDDAADQIRSAMKKENENYVEEKGEAAFYGPKIDVQIRNVFGKEDSIATIQVDIVVPKRMDITFVNESGEREHIVIIHRAIIGSYERFVAFLIEQYAGAFPTWLAPVQVAVLPITDGQMDYARKVAEELKANGIRTQLDSSKNKVEFKIREAQLRKIPYMLIIGKKEEESKTVSVRTRKGEVENAVKIEGFEKRLLEEIRERKK